MNILSTGNIDIPNLYSADVIKLATIQKYNLSETSKINKNTLKHKLQNPLCGDEVQFNIEYNHQQIISITHQTKGCILCQASANLCCETFNKMIFNEIIQQINLLHINNPKPNFINQWQIFTDVLKIPSRILCVTLPLQNILEMLRLKHNKTRQ